MDPGSAYLRTYKKFCGKAKEKVVFSWAKQEAVAEDASSTMGAVGRRPGKAVNGGGKILRAGKPRFHAEEVIVVDRLLFVLLPVKYPTFAIRRISE